LEFEDFSSEYGIRGRYVGFGLAASGLYDPKILDLRETNKDSSFIIRQRADTAIAIDFRRL
jgi:hypothetical protein